MNDSLLKSNTILEEGVLYRIMGAEDLEEAANCFTASFQREPMVKNLGITKEEFLPFAIICCEQAIKDEMGMVAIDELTNEVVGFTILQDALGEIPFPLDQNKNFLPIFEMLGQLQTKYIEDKKIVKKGEVVVSFVTGVNPDYQGKKVSIVLFGQSMDLAKQAGYKKMITEVTGRLSQNAVKRRYAFIPYSSILYKEFTFDGKAIFGDIEDQTLSCILMERCLLN